MTDNLTNWLPARCDLCSAVIYIDNRQQHLGLMSFPQGRYVALHCPTRHCAARLLRIVEEDPYRGRSWPELRDELRALHFEHERVTRDLLDADAARRRMLSALDIVLSFAYVRFNIASGVSYAECPECRQRWTYDALAGRPQHLEPRHPHQLDCNLLKIEQFVAEQRKMLTHGEQAGQSTATAPDTGAEGHQRPTSPPMPDVR